jgi:hypothetical protein
MTLPLVLHEKAKQRVSPTAANKPQVKVNFTLLKLPPAEIPVPMKTRTGGSVEAFYNSITRTKLKKALRQGDRYMFHLS